jgi:hypothetical protein
LVNIARPLGIGERIFVYDSSITDSAALCLLLTSEEDEGYILMNADIQDADACWIYAYPLLDMLIPMAINLTPTQGPDSYKSRMLKKSVMRVAKAPPEFMKSVEDMDRAVQAYPWEKLQEGPIIVPYTNGTNCLSNKLFKSVQESDREQRKKTAIVPANSPSDSNLLLSGFRMSVPSSTARGRGDQPHLPQSSTSSTPPYSMPKPPFFSRLANLAVSSQNLTNSSLINSSSNDQNPSNLNPQHQALPSYQQPSQPQPPPLPQFQHNLSQQPQQQREGEENEENW